MSDFRRDQATKITRIDSHESIANYDDALFLRSGLIDFTFRIEEVGYLSYILTMLYGEHIGNDAKFHEYLQVKQLQENPSSANVIIQTGCDNFCSFCIVPFTRGREVSRSQEEIVSEVREVVARGTREITLLGQNVNSYGKEAKKKLWNPEELTWVHTGVSTPFRELLDALGEIDGLDRIRFTSSNPHDMTKDILDAHFDMPHMCPYLHFALQSGSNTMLKRMNRKHTYEDFQTQVKYLRSRDPLFSISTDIIVGFPGETLEEFEATARAMRECQFDFAYIARYSPRVGTRATDTLEDDVSPQEKARRWSILNEILRETVTIRSRLLIGKTQEVLVSSFDDEGRACGRTRNFKEVYLDPSRTFTVGDIITAEIYELDGWVLKGREKV